MDSLARQCKLTRKQFEFVNAYLRNDKLDACAAYMRVYVAKNKKIGGANASKLLAKPKVMKYISEIEKRVESRTVCKVVATRERIIEEESCIAFLDPIDMLDEDGKFLPVNRMPEHVRRALQSLKIKSKELGADENLSLFEIISEPRFYNKGQALDRLEKIFGMQRETIDLTGDGLKMLLEEIDGKTRGILPSDRDE